MATRNYRIRMPADRWIRAACEQVRCEQWLFGWDSLIDERTPLGKAQAAYIRTQSGRTFREMKAPDGLTVFRFEPRQRCFAEHRTRPARLTVEQDTRRGPLVLATHTSLASLAEDYTEHIAGLAGQIGKG